MRKKAGKKNLPAALPEDSSHIIITIAREYGSGGREIGLKVARALKIPFYDRELIAMEARECGLSSDYVESTEEGLSLRDTAWNWAAQSYGAFETHLFTSLSSTAAGHQADRPKRLLRHYRAVR
ncbi:MULTISPECIES: cytidylate kinase-like family protein [Eisenbergiella]|uniref:cytidylate kinase-like family protein n=1 Tax=Eisenbergiella TaxID=1432051 RepID=UPI0012B3A32E|nr:MULTISPECIES: cytidylate kinase family protein [Eisenbergiella]MDY2653231.1 cytidylate kinase family protein [Eisenbergiella porci]